MPGQWDFFLAHAGADIRAAEELFGHLAGRSRVFLDSRCLLLGDDWDRELPRAQRNALVTVVLISQGSEHAYYEREEIAQAIDMARRDPAGHRVVPVFLDRSSASRDEIPYGLRLKHGVSVEEAGGLAAVAQKLLALLDRLRRPAAAQATPEQMPTDGVSTTTAGFAGPTEHGPTRPWLITSWAEYQDVFGDGLPSSVSFLAHAVRGFFDNGGGRAYIARILGKGAACASLRLEPEHAEGVLCFEARSLGAWGNRLGVHVRPGTRVGLRISVHKAAPECVSAQDAGKPIEDFDNLGLDPRGPNFLPRVIDEGSKWVSCTELTMANGSSPRAGFAMLAGGFNGAPPHADEYCGEPSSPAAEPTGLLALARFEDVALLCVPDHVHPVLSDNDTNRIAGEMVAQCERLQDRFALLSVRQGMREVASIRPFGNTSFAALYYPWIRVAEPAVDQSAWVPAVGHVAGIFARCDLAQGVHRPPADQELRGVGRDEEHRAVEFDLGPDELDTLERLGVNAIRDLGDAGGVRVASALTVSIDAGWPRSIAARRFLSFVQESIDRGTRWARFETNDERLWRKLAEDITAFLKSLWESGALTGDKPEEAFFIKCDDTTVTQNDVDNGRAICLVGLALVEPRCTVRLSITIQTATSGAREG